MRGISLQGEELMANQEHLKQLQEAIEKKDVAVWNNWRMKNPKVRPDLRIAEFSSANLHGADLSEAKLGLADVSGADLSGADLSEADLKRASLNDANLSRSNLSDANLKGANLRRANLSDADLSGANFHDADLSGANLSGADIRNADLVSIDVDTKTMLDNATVKDCKIRLYDLERLTNYGGLTRGQRMDMIIVNPTAKLRSYYSGVWQWIYLIALTLFIYPYAFFLFTNYSKAEFYVSEESTTLARALGEYILSGGQPEGRIAWFVFSCFCFQLLYGILRTILIIKVKNLELYIESTGLQPKLSLRGRWGKLLMADKILFFINLCVVICHTWHFMQMRVPYSG